MDQYRAGQCDIIVFTSTLFEIIVDVGKLQIIRKIRPLIKVCVVVVSWSVFVSSSSLLLSCFSFLVLIPF